MRCGVSSPDQPGRFAPMPALVLRTFTEAPRCARQVRRPLRLRPRGCNAPPAPSSKTQPSAIEEVLS